MSRLRPHAFTLIEMLVVISVMAVLIAMLMPSLSKARASARAASCLSTQRGLGFLLQAYASEQKDWIPPLSLNFPGESGNWRGWPSRLVAAGLLAPLSNPLPDLATQGSKKPRTCPELKADVLAQLNAGGDNYAHYMMANMYTGSYSHPNWDSYASGPSRLGDFLRPVDSMALADATYNPATNRIDTHIELYGTNATFLANRLIVGLNGSGSVYGAVNLNGHRHDTNKVNFVFFDGHGETRKFEGAAAPYGGFGVLLSRTRKPNAYWDL